MEVDAPDLLRQRHQEQTAGRGITGHDEALHLLDEGWRVSDLDAARAQLVARGVQASEISSARGPRAFAFSDPEGRWFAVLG